MSAGPLVLGVADLLARSGRHRDEHLEATFDDLVVASSRVPLGESLRIDVHLESLNEALVVKGTTTAPWVGECRRCLGPIEATMAAPILEVFEDEPTEGETQPLLGGVIDLTTVVREAVLLELPLAPLCREDCQGLCVHCGADRNAEDCGCAPSDHDPRWSALDQLRFDET